MEQDLLPEWLQFVVFLIIYVALIAGGIGHIILSKDLDEARKKDPTIILID